MVRIVFMTVTVLLLGWGWYALSGGRDFVPGNNGVTILAPVGGDRMLGDPARVALTRPEPKTAPPPAPEPRVISLRVREPLTAKTVTAAPKPALEVAAAVPVVPKTETLPIETLPMDEIARALLNATTSSDVRFDPDAPVPLVAGLGSTRPLGSSLADGPQPEVTFDAPDVEIAVHVVSGNRVNLRDGPSTTFAVVTQLSEGVEVEVLDDLGDGWVNLRVLDSDTTGWMSDDFLTAAN